MGARSRKFCFPSPATREAELRNGRRERSVRPPLHPPGGGADGATLSAWISAAQGLLDAGLTLILTSRWRLPAAFYRRPDRLRRAHQVLHGNPRGLEFFAAAVRDLDHPEENAFLERLAAAGVELQTDMALDLVVAHRTDVERALLRRLPAYRTPVPVEGLVKLGLDLHEPRRLLDGLLAVSLIEQRDAPDLLAREYQCPATVADWLARQPGSGLESGWLGVAADFQLYLFRTARQTFEQAVAVHEALRAAGRRDVADRWVLDRIVEPMNRAGLYAGLLKDWLPPVCESAEPKTRAEALSQTGKQYWQSGDYRTALGYHQNALAIWQEIGDRASEGGSLHNIAGIHQGRGELDRALDLLQHALAIQQEIGNRWGECATLNSIATIHKARGEPDRALDLFQRALAIQQQIGHREGEGTTLNNIATIYQVRGELQRALDFLQRAIAIQQDIGNRALEGAMLHNISQIYEARGELDRALDLLQRALAIRQEIGDLAGEGATLNNISQIYDARGELGRALDFLQRALAIWQAIGDGAGEATTLNNISQIYTARGELDRALDLLQRALAIRQGIGDAAGLCPTLFNIGLIQWQKGESLEALNTWTSAYRQARSIGLAKALQNLERLALQIGLPDGLAGWESLARQLESGGQIDLALFRKPRGLRAAFSRLLGRIGRRRP